MAEKLTPKKKGRKPKLTIELVAAELVKTRGNIAATARKFKVDRSAIHHFISKHQNLATILADAREGMLDDAENSLYDAVLEGEAWAVCFYLKTQGKGRGYVERQEVRDVTDENVNAAIERELARLANRSESPPAGPAESGGVVEATAGTTNGRVPH